MKVKKGDTVIIRSGKDKGKEGKVIKALPGLSRVVVEGLNLRKKHVRSRKASQKGQIVSYAAPIDVSNVAIKDPKTGKPTRVKMRGAGRKKVRVSAKSGAEI